MTPSLGGLQKDTPSLYKTTKYTKQRVPRSETLNFSIKIPWSKKHNTAPDLHKGTWATYLHLEMAEPAEPESIVTVNNDSMTGLNSVYPRYLHNVYL